MQMTARTEGRGKLTYDSNRHASGNQLHWARAYLVLVVKRPVAAEILHDVRCQPIQRCVLISNVQNLFHTPFPIGQTLLLNSRGHTLFIGPNWGTHFRRYRFG